MKKRLFGVILALIMVLGVVPAAMAADPVAKIGETPYATFNEAIADANAMTGDVTVEIYGEVEFTNGMELKGNYSSITFEGMSETAKITINQSAGGDYLEAHGKTVVFIDLTLAKANPAWAGNSGHMGNYFSIQGGTVTYNGCTFLNGACTSGGTATYTDCIFRNDSEYGLWVYDDALVTVNGGEIASKKGIKVYSEGEDSVTSTLTVEGATFTGDITAKPAVAIAYAAEIKLIGNTYNNTTGVLELDSGSDADCEGVTFVAQDAEGNDIASTLTAVDRSSSNAPCGVLMDGKIYTAVTTAAADATSGSTVTLLHNSTETVELAAGVTLNKNNYEATGVTVAVPAATMNGVGYPTLQAAIDEATKTPGTYEIVLVSGTNDEDVVIHQTEGVNITIKGNGTNTIFTGYVEVYGHCRYEGSETLTFDGVVFQTSEASHVFIEQTCQTSTSESAAKCYPHNVTVQNCTFIATGDAENTAVGMKFRYGYDIKVADTTSTGLHSLMQNYAGVGLTVEDVTITGKNGIALGTSKNVTVTGAEITATGYGLRADAQNATTITIEDSEIEAFIPVVVRKAEQEVDLIFNGENTMTATNTDGLWCAIGASEYETNGTMPTAATGKVTVALNDTGLDADGVYPASSKAVAEVDGEYYDTLEEAFSNATEGQTITLLADATPTLTSQRAITSASVIDLNGKTLTLTEDDLYFGTTTFKNGTIEVDSSVVSSTAVFWMFEGQTLTFDAVEIVATGVTGTYLIGTNGGDEADIILQNGSKITIANTTKAGLTAVIAGNGTNDTVTIDNSTIDVSNIDGRVALGGSYTVKGASSITANGVKEGFYIRDGQSLSIEDTSSVTITLNPDDETRYGINLNGSATYTKAETATVNATIKGFYTITFDAGDVTGATIPSQMTIPPYDNTINTSPAASCSGYNFTGWHDGTSIVSFPYTVTGDVTLTAQWSEIYYAPTYRVTVEKAENGTVKSSATYATQSQRVTLTVTPDEGYALDTLTVVDSKGNEIEVTDKGDGKYTFKMPGRKVTVTASFLYDLPYTDVDAGDAFYDAVCFLHQQGLINGMGNNMYQPETSFDRAMIATMLHRLAGLPEHEQAAELTDVADGIWYTDAIHWGTEAGLINGYPDGTFAPGTDISVRELVVFLYRYAQYSENPNCDKSGWTGATWADAGLAWAEANSILPEGEDLNSPASRALAAQVIYNVYNLLNK